MKTQHCQKKLKNKKYQFAHIYKTHCSLNEYLLSKYHARNCAKVLNNSLPGVAKTCSIIILQVGKPLTLLSFISHLYNERVLRDVSFHLMLVLCKAN